MEALTALSLAGTVVQFVDFGTKLLSDGKGLYKSSTGALKVNEEFELVTADLRALNTKCRFGCSWPVERPCGPITEDQHDFEKICDGAAKVAEELIGRLNELKVKGSKHRKWESFQQALKSAWSKEEISSLLKRLSNFRDALLNQVLFSIRQVVSIIGQTGLT